MVMVEVFQSKTHLKNTLTYFKFKGFSEPVDYFYCIMNFLRHIRNVLGFFCLQLDKMNICLLFDL